MSSYEPWWFNPGSFYLDTPGEVAQHLIYLVGLLWLLEDLRRSLWQAVSLVMKFLQHYPKFTTWWWNGVLLYKEVLDQVAHLPSSYWRDESEHRWPPSEKWSALSTRMRGRNTQPLLAPRYKCWRGYALSRPSGTKQQVRICRFAVTDMRAVCGHECLLPCVESLCSGK